MSIDILANMTPAERQAHHVTSLVLQGEIGAALIAARDGLRDFPNVQLRKGATFERLATVLAAKAAEQGLSVPVSAVPVFTAPPVSAPPVFTAPDGTAYVQAPVSAPPVSAVPVSAPTVAVQVVIERTASDGTIIRLVKGMPFLKPIIGADARPDLGWQVARRGFMYLGDRDTSPNMHVIAQTLATLHINGIDAVNTVRGDEPARPVSAVPVSATPGATRTPTRRERQSGKRRNFPVTVTQVSAIPAAPVSAVPVSVAPVSAVPVPVAPSIDPTMAMIAAMAEQLNAQQKMLKDFISGKVSAPVAPVAPESVAPVAPVSVAPVAPSVEDVLASLMDEQLTEVMALTWKFKVAPGASVRKTVVEIRQDLHARVSGYYEARGLGDIVFGVFADGSDAKVIHVRVKTAAGDISPRKLTQQVVGTVLTVKGIDNQGRTAAK